MCEIFHIILKKNLDGLKIEILKIKLQRDREKKRKVAI